MSDNQREALEKYLNDNLTVLKVFAQHLGKTERGKLPKDVQNVLQRVFRYIQGDIDEWSAATNWLVRSFVYTLYKPDEYSRPDAIERYDHHQKWMFGFNIGSSHWNLTTKNRGDHLDGYVFNTKELTDFKKSVSLCWTLDFPGTGQRIKHLIPRRNEQWAKNVSEFMSVFKQVPDHQRVGLLNTPGSHMVCLIKQWGFIEIESDPVQSFLDMFDTFHEMMVAVKEVQHEQSKEIEDGLLKLGFQSKQSIVRSLTAQQVNTTVVAGTKVLQVYRHFLQGIIDNEEFVESYQQVKDGFEIDLDVPDVVKEVLYQYRTGTVDINLSQRIPKLKSMEEEIANLFELHQIAQVEQESVWQVMTQYHPSEWLLTKDDVSLLQLLKIITGAQTMDGKLGTMARIRMRFGELVQTNYKVDVSSRNALHMLFLDAFVSIYREEINLDTDFEQTQIDKLEMMVLSQINQSLQPVFDFAIVKILPENDQINGMYRLPDENFLQEMVNCHTEGITVENLVKAIRIRGEYTQEYLDSVPGQLNRGYHFFGLQGDKLVHNEVSQAYAAGDVGPMMVAAFQNFYLLAEVLEWLNRHPDSRHSEIVEAMQEHYPQWTSNTQPGIRTWWLRFFGLISPDLSQNLRGKRLSITEKGQQVLARIDFTNRDLIGLRPKVEKPKEVFTESCFQDILNKIRENTKDQKIVVDVDEIKDIHNGFHANSEKRFIILSGLSGTGKTKMLQEYARAYCDLQDLEYEAHVFPVAVTPAFRDHTLLLGYLNPLTEPPRYIEGEITALLREAAETPHLPYFLILDEMNLARVEFYLAPILSAMESDEGVLFHNSDDVDFPQRIKQWPSNIFMAGTVNMDETTHAFSDKVLDRAFTMEFWDINLATYFEQSPTDAFVEETITNVYNALKPAHLHFGYRTVKAIVDYVDRAVKTDANDQKRALDQAIFSKVLPKLKGQKTGLLTKTLDEMLKVCAVLSRKSGETEKSKTLNKLTQMQARLKDTGLTRFWR